VLFKSLEFAIFLPLVVGLYFCLPWRYRTPLLLVASCIFYMAFIPVYILILFVTITIDYIAGIYIERSNGPARRAWLIGSIERNRNEIIAKANELTAHFDFPLWDYSGSPICRDRSNFYNSQHLNRNGASAFSDEFAKRLVDAVPGPR
jgi:hypothetical protein